MARRQSKAQRKGQRKGQRTQHYSTWEEPELPQLTFASERLSQQNKPKEKSPENPAQPTNEAPFEERMQEGEATNNAGTATRTDDNTNPNNNP